MNYLYINDKKNWTDCLIIACFQVLNFYLTFLKCLLFISLPWLYDILLLFYMQIVVVVELFS